MTESLLSNIPTIILEVLFYDDILIIEKQNNFLFLKKQWKDVKISFN